MNQSHALKLLTDLFNAGQRMRADQRAFFNAKSQTALIAAKDSEREFDQTIYLIEKEFQFETKTAQAHQIELFTPEEKQTWNHKPR